MIEWRRWCANRRALADLVRTAEQGGYRISATQYATMRKLASGELDECGGDLDGPVARPGDQASDAALDHTGTDG